MPDASDSLFGGLADPDFTDFDLFGLASEPSESTLRPKPIEIDRDHRLRLGPYAGNAEGTEGWVVAYLGLMARLREELVDPEEVAEHLRLTVEASGMEPAEFDFHVREHLTTQRAKIDAMIASHEGAVAGLRPDAEAVGIDWTPYLSEPFPASGGHSVEFVDTTEVLSVLGYRFGGPFAKYADAARAARDAAAGRAQVFVIVEDEAPVSFGTLHARDGVAVASAGTQGFTAGETWTGACEAAVAEMLSAVAEGSLVPRMAVHGDRFVARR